MTQAWMLRQDGEAFPVRVHLYAMGDGDLSSEAEVASFIKYTDSGDQNLADEVLDAWMALLIEKQISYDDDAYSIDQKIENALNHLPYKFPYSIGTSKLLTIHDSLKNYTDSDTYYEYVDDVREKLLTLQASIATSLNQQFSRVRYGGTYNEENTGDIWCRVSSANYNWANTFYIFIAKNRKSLGISHVNICRDPESDKEYDAYEIEYFYKAKDGTPYYHMPIDEYLQEEHEHSPVFSTRTGMGVIFSIRNRLARGESPYSVCCSLMSSRLADVTWFNMNWYKLVKQEQTKCIKASEYFDNAPTRTKTRLQKMMRAIVNTYPEIDAVDISAEPYESMTSKRIGIKYMFELESKNEKLDHVVIDVAFTRPEITVDEVLRGFRREYTDYKQYMKVRV